MTHWLIFVDEADAHSDCANERIDLALGALAMGDEVCVVFAGRSLSWRASTEEAALGPSVLKRMRQIPLYGGELCRWGSAGDDALFYGVKPVDCSQLRQCLNRADRVLT